MALSRNLLLPALLGRDWWDCWEYPPRIMDQHFGVGLVDGDLLPPTFYRGYILRPRTQANFASSGHSEVTSDSDKFQVILNVSQFKPEEMSVKTVDNYVLVHGKHEEKTDDHGFVSREFTRRYMLPQGVESESVTSSLSQDGLLTIQAPKKALEPIPINERSVPISMQNPAGGQQQAASK